MTKNKKLSEEQKSQIESTAKETVTIRKANIKQVRPLLEGVSPLVQNAFPKKIEEELAEKHQAGGTSRSKKGNREAKNFGELFKNAMHVGIDGRHGIPCAAFRAACIDACRLVDMKMTNAKMSLFCVEDTIDQASMEGLVCITKGEPQMHRNIVRLPNGNPDVRIRALWLPGWQVQPTFEFDADQFTVSDVYNLLERAGLQVGIGEGRPFSKNSFGMGWGRFKIVS